MPKDHLEEISNAGVTELLRSPEEALEKRLEVSLEIQDRQEEMDEETRQENWSEEMEKTIKSEEKKQRKNGQSKIDWSQVSNFSEVGGEKIKRYEIGDGIFVELNGENKDQVKHSKEGEIWLAEDLTLELRNKEELLGNFDIESSIITSFKKCETEEKDTGKKVYLITWRTKSGKELGVGVDKVGVRNRLYEDIGNLQSEVQRDKSDEEMGFGLFD